MAHLAPLRRKSAGPDVRGGRKKTAAPAAKTGTFGTPVQAKLAIGPSRDRFETEADRAASHVMGNAPGTPSITPLALGGAQRRAAEEEDALQRSLKDDREDIQRKSKTEEEAQAQRNGVGPAQTASSAVESGVRAARGGGAPLQGETKSRMEQGFGRDFGAVRVHDDARAASLNQQINARAFATGSDIFFGQGAYAPGTTSGDHLLAHELAHVAQQTGPGRVQTNSIQRNSPAENDDVADPPPGPVFSGRGVRQIDISSRPWVFTVPTLRVPRVDSYVKGVTAGPGQGGLLPSSGAFRWTGKGSRTMRDEDGGERAVEQRQVWDQGVRDAPGLRSALEAKVANADYDIRRVSDNEPIYYLRHTRGSRDNFTATGTLDQLTQNHILLRPPFTRTGRFGFVDVDHYKEIQLGGEHRMSNLWLLTSAANQESGRQIKADALGAVEELNEAAEQGGFWGNTNPAKPSFRSNNQKSWPDPSQIQIVFNRITHYNLAGQGWTQDDISSGRQLSQVKSYKQDELIRDGIILDRDENNQPIAPSRIQVFSSSASSFRKELEVDGTTLVPQTRRNRSFIEGFNISSATFANNLSPAGGDEIGQLVGTPFLTGAQHGGTHMFRGVTIEAQNAVVPILATSAPDFTGYLDKRQLNASLSSIRAYVRGASPITFDALGLNENFEITASAHVQSDAPIFSNLRFDVRIIGNELVIDAPIPAENLSLGPFEVTEASLQIGYGEDGLFFGGTAGFRINGVGEGTFEARNLAFAGDFNFDIDAFDPANVLIRYSEGVWTGSANLGIKPGTIPFVERGNITAGMDEAGNFAVSGIANLAGPGIPEGTELQIGYNQETGEFTFGGEVPLDTERLPGVRNARVGFAVTRAEDGSYRVSGNGSAAFDLPGVTGTVDIGYQDGIITANGEATISRPPLTGSANFHLSNQAVGDDGQPIEGPPLDSFRVWGGGSASIEFGDYITATAGIEFLENGEIELEGTIALPPSITLINAADYHYDIFTFPEVRFPILGFTIPVINRSFGVFGFVRAGLDANLTLGPGELVDSEVTVSYNPDRPEDMSITGGSTFQIGASADVGLRVTGGVGAGLAIVEATGEIGLRGALGLELSGGAAVELNWTPTDGLAIDASVFGEVQPTFSVSIVADARVVVDAFLYSGTLWNESWERELASIGPDMRWRAELPASWSERDGLDVDINDLELTYPDIDIADFAEDVFDAIV
ncbi:MAG: DUF4157 domain-containing protein [Roseobacter sp.]